MFKLTGNLETKLASHQGLYTSSYQMVKAQREAAIRNWEITLQDHLYQVKNSTGEIATVYFEKDKIENCDCPAFIDSGCLTCLHIQALHLLNRKERLPKTQIRPLTFTTNRGTLGSIGEKNINKTPSVATLIASKLSKQIPFYDQPIANVDVFTEHQINLFPFQQQAITQMIKGKKSILTLKMGLGKTLCALACCKILEKNKILIISPNSLKYQWQKEINRFNLGSSIVIAKGSDLVKYQDQKFVIISYEMLNFNKQFLNNVFDIAIIDEIQKIKNGESETWKTINQVQAEFIFTLSGTPIQNNINDLISIINFLNPHELKPDWRFYQEYCQTTRARILGILPDRIDDFKHRVFRYIINPTIDYSTFPLPEKKEHTTQTTLDNLQQEFHDDHFDAARILLAKSVNYPLTFGERMALNGMLTKARMAASDARLISEAGQKSAKFQQIEQRIFQLIEQDKKIVIYSEWIKSLSLLIPYLQENNIGFVEFNGEINPKKRHQALSDFMEDLEIKVFLSTDTGGLGLDGLQLVSHNVIHLEKVWNPAKVEQRNGRVVRTLQKSKQVNVYYFQTNSGIEAMIMSNNDRKHSLISDILS